MRVQTGMRAGAALLLLVAAGATLSGCGNDAAKPGAWSNSWYAKNQTPEEVAKYRRKHPTTGAPKHDDQGDESNPGGMSPGGGMGPG